MAQKRATAFLLALAMLAATLFAGTLPVYGEGTEYTDVPWQSELTVRNPQTAYRAGDRITLELSVSPEQGGRFAVRTYGNILSFDTRRFTLVETAPASGLGSANVTQDNYKPDASSAIQKIQWTFWDNGTNGSAAERTGVLTLGSITLEVKDTAGNGETEIQQQIEGLSDGNGLWATRVAAASCSVKLSQPELSCSFELKPANGQTQGWKAGDEVELTLAVHSAGTFAPRLAGTEILFDQSVFDYVGAAPAANQVWAAEKAGGRIAWTYWDQSAPEKADVLTLGSMTLRVKDGAADGETVLSQQEANLVTYDKTNQTETLYENTKAPALQLTVGTAEPEPTPGTVKVQVRANYDSMGTVSGGGVFAEGDRIAVKAEPKNGYRFTGWTVKGDGVLGNSAAAETTFTVGAGNAELTAVFVPSSARRYEASLAVEGTESQIYRPGDQASLSLLFAAEDAPQNSYGVRLLEDEITIDSSIWSVLAVTAPDSRTTVTTRAGVQAGTEVIRVLYYDGNPAVTTGALKLAGLTLEVKPDAKVGNTSLTHSVALFSDEKGDELTANVTAQAKVLEIGTAAASTYELSVKANDPAMGTVNGGGLYEAGAKARLEAQPKSGFKFVGWTGGDGGSFDSTSSAATTFTMPAKAVTVTAVFAALTDPTVTPVQANYDLYSSGSGLGFTLNPGDYSFTGIQGMTQTADYTVNGTSVALLHSALQRLGVGSHTLTFEFSGGKTAATAVTITDSTPEPKAYKLTAEPNYDSMGTVTGSGSYKAGELAAISASAKTGYRFIRWEAPAGVEIDNPASASAVLKMPARPIRVTAVFASADTRAYEALLTVEDQQAAYRPGDRIAVTVQAKAADENPYGIRTVDTYITVDTSRFDITSVAGISGGAVTAATVSAVDEGSSNIHIYYYNANAQETAAGPTDLAKLLLTVKADAPTGGAMLTQTVVGFVDAKGDDLTGNVISSGADFVIEEASKGVTVSGYVGALPGANGGDAVTGVRNITITFADGLTAVTDETGHFSVMAVPSGDYEVTFTGTGVVERKETIQVRDQDLQVSSAEKMIGVLRGDYNGDNDINLSDLTEFMKTYKKNSTMEGFSPVGDYNYDNDISLEDLTLFMQHYKKDSSYYENWAY